METINVKIVKFYETNIEVPADLEYEYRREYARKKARQKENEPKESSLRYLEASEKLNYEGFFDQYINEVL